VPTTASLTTLVAALVAAGLVAAACSTGAQPRTGSVSASVRPPEPVGAAVATTPPSTSAAPAQSCDPRASLRPTGALPPAGEMSPGSTMQGILKRGRLIAGVDQNTYLFGFRNSFSGQIEGFDIDVVRQIAQAIFGDPNRVQFKVLTSNDRIPALEHHDVDLVVRTMSATCDRLQSVSFSTIYYLAGQRVLVRRDSGIGGIGDLAGKKVCAAKGSTSVPHIAAASPKAVTVTVDDWTDCLVMLQQGQVDAISTDDAILAGLAAQDPYTEVVGPRFSDEPYGVAMPKSADDFVRFVNGVLERMRADGTWGTSYQRWLRDRLGPATAPVAMYQD
jgi:polar amino acid transport system substrate-binding protein